ncbi:MAG TPA: hypothetical protein VIV57_21230 [Anaeromyxobacter sp.]
MRARTPAWLALAALAGCPIPQPLPDYPAGSPVTPPRIVVDRIPNADTVIRVPAGCTTAPAYDLGATLIDVITIDVVRVRWFVNYDPNDSSRYRPEQEADIFGVNVNPPVTERTVPTFTFRPYDGFPTIANTGGGSGRNEGALHVVELVVSNGFDPAATDNPPSALPYRTPLAGFETQVYRWTFLTVLPSPTVTCPP